MSGIREDESLNQFSRSPQAKEQRITPKSEPKNEFIKPSREREKVWSPAPAQIKSDNVFESRWRHLTFALLRQGHLLASRKVGQVVLFWPARAPSRYRKECAVASTSPLTFRLNTVIFMAQKIITLKIRFVSYLLYKARRKDVVGKAKQRDIQTDKSICCYLRKQRPLQLGVSELTTNRAHHLPICGCSLYFRKCSVLACIKYQCHPTFRQILGPDLAFVPKNKETMFGQIKDKHSFERIIRTRQQPCLIENKQYTGKGANVIAFTLSFVVSAFIRNSERSFSAFIIIIGKTNCETLYLFYETQ